MKNNEKIFKEIALKHNKDFNYEQFSYHNKSLFSIIIESMNECQKQLKLENKKLKNILDDDIDFKAMRNYAKSLERKLNIDPDKNK